MFEVEVAVVLFDGFVLSVMFVELRGIELDEEVEVLGGNCIFPSGVPAKATFKSDHVYIKSPPKLLIVIPSCCPAQLFLSKFAVSAGISDGQTVKQSAKPCCLVQMPVKTKKKKREKKRTMD